MKKSIYSAPQEHLRALLKQVRKGAGLSQRDLSERLAKPQSFVSRYESGQRRLDLLELREICEVVGVPLVEFVKRLERSMP